MYAPTLYTQNHNFGINAHDLNMCVYTKVILCFLRFYNHSQLAVLKCEACTYIVPNDTSKKLDSLSSCVHAFSGRCTFWMVCSLILVPNKDKSVYVSSIMHVHYKATCMTELALLFKSETVQRCTPVE